MSSARAIRGGIVFLAAIALLYGLNGLTKSTTFQFFGKLVNRVETADNVVALTFDDGPHAESTEMILDVLDRHHAKATFFVVGEGVEAHPELVRMMVARGHEVGNHSYSHRRMISERPGLFRDEIERTDGLLRDLGVDGEIHFRAPYGRKLFVLPYLLSEMGKTNVLWNVDPMDLYEPDGDVVANRVIEGVRPGSIVVMHDKVKTAGSLDRIITGLHQRGFELTTVRDLMSRAENRPTR